MQWLQLYRTPTIWSVLCLCAYALNLLFHVIAFGSNHWVNCILDGKYTWFGLWQGCWNDDITGETKCSTAVFDNQALNTDTRWHQGAQVMMTCSLLVLLFMEFVLIGYACIERLKPYKQRMTGILVAMSIAEATMASLTLLMVGSEVGMLDTGSLSWGYALIVVSLCLSICTFVLLYKDKHHYYKSSSDLDINNDEATEKNDFDNPAFTDRGSTEISVSVVTSELRLSSSGFGTLERDSARSFSCSDIAHSTNGVSYAQEVSQKSISGKQRISGSLDNMALRDSHVSYCQEPIRRTSASDLVGTVNMSQEQTKRPKENVNAVNGTGRIKSQRASTSSIESDV